MFNVSEGSGAFLFGEHVKIAFRKLSVSIPVLVLVASGVFFGIDSLTAHSSGAPVLHPVSATPQIAVSTNLSSSSQPSPASPSPKITVAGTRSGDLLSIPAIGLNASVVSVGLTADNAIDVPAGPQVGYWTGGATPGTPGATFLDGHVDGIFAHLNRLAVGQTFSIRFNNEMFYYQVAHTETVALDGIDMKRALSTYGGVSEGLNIMTCAGSFIPSMDTYDQRFVVYAVRIS